MIYWDTSAVLKLYVQESDSAKWERIAMDETYARVSSRLLEAEFSFAVRQKELRGEVKPGGAAQLVKRLRHDTTLGFIQMYPMNAEVFAKAVDLALHQSRRDSMRTLDGLHLASALLLNARLIATADDRMRVVAKAMGFDLAGE